jgi:hypothetical protein
MKWRPLLPVLARHRVNSAMLSPAQWQLCHWRRNPTRRGRAEERFIATLRRYDAGWGDWYGWKFRTFVVRTDHGLDGFIPAPLIAVVNRLSPVDSYYDASFNGTRQGLMASRETTLAQPLCRS